MNARVLCGQRADAAMFRGNGENVPARLHHRPRRRRRKRKAADILRNVLELRARLNVFRIHCDRNFARFVACQVVFVKQPAIFVDNGVRAQARPLDVVFLVIGELLRLLRTKVVVVEIHHAVAVADEINGVPVPHGEHVHALGLGQLFIGVVLQVVDGDGQIPAAVVALPRAEFLRGFDIRDLRSVGREGSQVAPRNWQLLGHASLRRHQE